MKAAVGNRGFGSNIKKPQLGTNMKATVGNCGFGSNIKAVIPNYGFGSKWRLSLTLGPTWHQNGQIEQKFEKWV